MKEELLYIWKARTFRIQQHPRTTCEIKSEVGTVTPEKCHTLDSEVFVVNIG